MASYYDGPAGNGNQGGFDVGRLVRMGVGVAIALFAIVAYSFRTEVNPVTGQRQHIGMEASEEMALGLKAAPDMAKQMGGVIPAASDPRAAMVGEVGHKLVNKGDASRSPYAENFHFYLLNDPTTINAFALPGGQIFITKALFDKLTTEAELAGVLGHEIGHVVNRHAAQHMAKGQLGQLLTMAVGVGASGSEQDQGRTAQMAAMMANQMVQLKYGRNDESEADEYGLKYMAEAGYDPRAMLEVMSILKEASKGGKQPEILSTHPLPETRIDRIKELIAKSYPDGQFGDLNKGRSLSTGGGGRLSR